MAVPTRADAYFRLWQNTRPPERRGGARGDAPGNGSKSDFGTLPHHPELRLRFQLVTGHRQEALEKLNFVFQKLNLDVAFCS
jgi:hypothetical protein